MGRQHWTRTRGGQRREDLRRQQNSTALEGSLGTTATYRKEEVSSGTEHLAAWTASHWRGSGDSGVETAGSARTGPVGTAGPLKARGAVAFGWRVALGVKRPPIGKLGWREWSLTSGPAPI
jgi:hypothetical protein